SVVFNPTSLSAKKTSKVTITVSPTAGDIDSSIKPTGTVKFYDGATSTTVVASGTLSNGVVTLSLPKFKKASHTFRVEFTGTTSSFDSFKLNVTKSVGS
ncbi:MAG: hypothetical protein JWQ70_297, partial [Aeromicrobium sp.]|nr:hypothetical protein [Aeromicrobium sp.]